MARMIIIVYGCADDLYLSTEGTVYSIYCGLDWPSGTSGDDIQHIPYTSNLTECIHLCDTSNMQIANGAGNSVCVGVSFNLGPNFLGCWLKSRMSGSGVVKDDAGIYSIDSAKRFTQTMVLPFKQTKFQ